MGQCYNWQLQLHYHVWWVVLHPKSVKRILFSPKKHVKIGSYNKLHIHLKRELSHETMLPDIIPTTKHMNLWHSLMSVSLSSITNAGQNYFISRSLLWSNIVLQVPLIVFAQTCVVIVQWKQQSQHRSLFGILVDCSEENPSYSCTYTHFSPHWKSCSAQTWLPKLLLKWCHHLIHRLTCAVFMNPNTCYRTLLNGLTGHNCHSHLNTTHY